MQGALLIAQLQRYMLTKDHIRVLHKLSEAIQLKEGKDQELGVKFQHAKLWLQNLDEETYENIQAGDDNFYDDQVYFLRR